MSSLDKFLFKSSAQFLIELFWWYRAAFVVCKFRRIILYQLHHLQILSPFPWVVFISLMVVYTKLLSLIRLHLFFFLLLFPLLWETDQKGNCSWSQSFLPRFSFKSFAVSSLTFSSLIHFVLKSVLISFLTCIIAIQFSQHHLLKRLSSLHCIFLPTLS